MSRKLLLFSLLFGLSASAQTASDVSPDPDVPTFHKAGRTPFWLPRAAFLGTYLRGGAVTPQPRLQWQFTFFEDRQDALVFLLEGGIGYAVALPDTAIEGYDIPIHTFYEHTVMTGFGYRNQDREGIHWGFQVTGGPLWYGAHLTNVDNEHYTVGLVEGRIQVGYTFGPVVLGVSGGYGEPFSYSKHSVARLFAGGALLGLFADWR
ncbi:MAG: hypothetical protein ACJ8AT_16480 [Hyalangium sp.]|uniref:hypothetical protein n=1 Tax=Hyalangium sp. TaxID=2028555 RepID=UPI00389987E3